MSDGPFEDSQAYQGLQPLNNASFPKICPKCRRTFADMTEFIRETEPVGDQSGLMSVLDVEKKTVLLLMRNCRCGTTTSVFCRDRRRQTETAIRRRVNVAKLMEILMQSGVAEDEARSEAIKVFAKKP